MEPQRGKGAVIVGWEREERDGWKIRYIRVDGNSRNEWNIDSQEPAVIHMRPGEVSLGLMAVKAKSKGSGLRRYRSAPVTFKLEAGSTQLCVVRIRGKRRRRPRASCEEYLAAPTRAAHEDTPFGEEPGQPGSEAEGSEPLELDARLEARFRSIEERLNRLELLITRFLDENREETDTQLKQIRPE